MAQRNKYLPNGQLKEKQWRIGWNICRVIRFQASPRDNHVLYKATLRNIHDTLLEMVYVVPNSSKPHKLVADLKFFASGTKPWLSVKLDMVNNVPMIMAIKEEKEPQGALDEIHQQEKSLIV